MNITKNNLFFNLIVWLPNMGTKLIIKTQKCNPVQNRVLQIKHFKDRVDFSKRQYKLD